MKKSYIWIGVTVVVIGLLLGWGKISGTTKPLTFWNGTEIACLPNGHEQLAMHIHQDLAITVDGVKEDVPANLGIASNCMAEVHTHDATGKLHEESATTGKSFKLKDFFTVWGKSIDRPGYSATLTVNGEIKPEMGEFVLTDGQTITLAYVSAGVVPAAAPVQ